MSSYTKSYDTTEQWLSHTQRVLSELARVCHNMPGDRFSDFLGDLEQAKKQVLAYQEDLAGENMQGRPQLSLT